MIISRSL